MQPKIHVVPWSVNHPRLRSFKMQQYHGDHYAILSKTWCRRLYGAVRLWAFRIHGAFKNRNKWWFWRISCFWATFDKGMPFCLQRRQRVVVVVVWGQPGLHYAMSSGWIQWRWLAACNYSVGLYLVWFCSFGADVFHLLVGRSLSPRMAQGDLPSKVGIPANLFARQPTSRISHSASSAFRGCLRETSATSISVQTNLEGLVAWKVNCNHLQSIQVVPGQTGGGSFKQRLCL